MAKDNGIVLIHGKEYQTVASRVQKFREAYKFEYSIETELVSIDESTVVMKATIKNSDGRVVATGYAEESRTASQINRTSALENCETSAIGRCLASAGMAGTEYASADEVAQAISQQGASVKTYPNTAPATVAQASLILAKAKEYSGLDTKEAVLNWFFEKTGMQLGQVKKIEVDNVIKFLEEERDV